MFIYIYIYILIYIYIKPDILPHTKEGFPKNLQEVVWGAPGHMRLSTTRCWVKLKAINGKKKKKRERKQLVTGFDFAGKQIN